MEATRTDPTLWFIAASLVAATVVAPGLEAQEADSQTESGSAQDTGAVEHPQIEFRAGVRLMAFVSAGGSLEFVWNTPGRLPVLSLQLFSYSSSWEDKPSREKTAARFVMGRMRMAIGKGEGGSLFVFYDRGRRWMTAGPYTGDAGVWGVGVGAGLTIGWFVSSFEVGIGESTHPTSYYMPAGIHFQIRLLGF